MKMSVAPRCLSSSTTKAPRKPPPPVTITRLFCQKLSAMFLRSLHDELCVPVSVICWISDQPGLQGMQDLAHTVINIQGRIKPEYAFDLLERNRDIAHIAAKSQILVFNHCLRHAFEHQLHDILLRIISMLGSQIENLTTDLFTFGFQTHDHTAHHITNMHERT